MSQKLQVTVEIQSSADKFYDFFKNHMSDLVNVFPATFKSVQLIEGEEGSVGSVKLWNYVLGGISMTAKVKVEAINDEERSITFAVVEGNLLQLYKSYNTTLTASNGSVKWSIEYEKAIETVPIPDIYVTLSVEVSKAVDLYLLTH
ncbi:MLP 34 [Olea europaea subsp. europaea]|uniref:MLP 34 n=1 Tax=Olea europaea subsp. europaea TaxID=158383 RepID=A0A8S0T8X4_OLEEU|nr:MLP 34 [Olea europaea subsp. europaea]